MDASPTSGPLRMTWAFWEKSSHFHFRFRLLSDQPAAAILELP